MAPTPTGYWVAIAMVALGAAALRLYRIGEVPAGLFCDEAANGYNAYTLLHTGQDEHGRTWPLFVWSFFAFKYPLDIYPSMLWVGLLGLTETATRMQAAVYGIGGVVLAFLIGRRMDRPLAGLLAAVALAVMPWHLHFSRVAFAMTSFVFWFGLAFLFLVRALAPDCRRRDWWLAGACFSMCFYAYAVTQVLVPLFLLLALPFCLEPIRRHFRWALEGAVVAVVVALPFVVFYVRYLDRATVYVEQTSILARTSPLGMGLIVLAAFLILLLPALAVRCARAGTSRGRAGAALLVATTITISVLGAWALGAVQGTAFAEQLDLIFRHNYPEYLFRIDDAWRVHARFLLESGDPILRHGPRGFGVLLPAMVPWIVLGVAVSLVRRGAPYKLLLLWLVLFPIGAVVTRETPSATRSAVGMLTFALLFGLGAERLFAAARLLPFAVLRGIAWAAVALVVALPLARQSSAWVRHYFERYPLYSAVGIEGFQYGYRELFREMEKRRDEVDALYRSSTVVNNPYIFNLFYVRRPPLRLNEWGNAETEYVDLRPVEIDRWYHPHRDVLLAALPIDMPLFAGWEERVDIEAPGGELAFVLLRNPRPKEFLDRWEILGPFANPENRRRTADLVDPESMQARATPIGGETSWLEHPTAHGRVELNRSLGQRIPELGNNPEWMIAYLRTGVTSDHARDARLELFGSRDDLGVWVNGRSASPGLIPLDEVDIVSLPIRLEAGKNVLLFKSVETVGDWWFFARIADETAG